MDTALGVMFIDVARFLRNSDIVVNIMRIVAYGGFTLGDAGRCGGGGGGGGWEWCRKRNGVGGIS